MSFGISAQGTLIARSIDPLWPDASPQGGPLAFNDIAELMDIKPPALTRKALETTTHNQEADRFIVGIKRHGEMTIKVNFIPGDSTHDNETGLQQAYEDGSRDIYRLTYPDGTQWLFSGYVINFSPTANADSVLTADVTIRPTGDHAWDEA